MPLRAIDHQGRFRDLEGCFRVARDCYRGPHLTVLGDAVWSLEGRRETTLRKLVISGQYQSWRFPEDDLDVIWEYFDKM